MVILLTTFQEVYNYFLSKITTYEFGELTQEELDLELEQSLKSTIAKCVVLEKIELDTTLKEFSRDLSNLEMDIISYGMVVEYLTPKIYSIELLKQSLNSSDYTMYSQANHLAQLLNTKKDATYQFHYWMNRYGFLKKMGRDV